MKKKLNLNGLKVKSFVTTMEKGRSQTIKGGNTYDSCGADCQAWETNFINCGVTWSGCGGGGGTAEGGCASDGCSNNSCFECHVF